MSLFINLLRTAPFRLTLVRFGMVSLMSELVYFCLYGFFLPLTGSTAATLAIAGGVCSIVAAYSHSRVTFRVPFGRRLLFGYLQIQLLGFLLAFAGGLALEKWGANKWMIGILTYAFWSITSFCLTKILYSSWQKSKTPVQHPYGCKH